MSALTFSIDIETLGHETHTYHLLATAEERSEVANRLSLLSLEHLEAEIQIRNKERIHLTGKIKADVTQECVRTLQPLPQHLEFHADEIFTLKPLDEQEEVDVTEDVIVEPLEGSVLDVGEVIIQLLSLNLDPFPVSPVSTPIDYTESAGPSSPFEVLKKK